MILDLFTRPQTQCEQVYAFIKGRGRVLSHELNQFALQNKIGCPGTRARELKAKGLIWHIRGDLMTCIYPHSKEEAWSTHIADKEIT